MDIIYILHHIREPWYLVLDHINNLLIQNCDLAGIFCMVIACNDSMIFQTPFSRPRISIYVQTLIGPLHHTGWHPVCGSCGWKKKIVQPKGRLFSNSKMCLEAQEGRAWLPVELAVMSRYVGRFPEGRVPRRRRVVLIIGRACPFCHYNDILTFTNHICPLGSKFVGNVWLAWIPGLFGFLKPTICIGRVYW